MPQPTVSDVHVDAILTNISVAYMQEADNFVASRAFPQIPVNKQSDKYFTYSQADFFRDQVQLRADGTPSAGTGYSLSTATYAAEVYALHKDIGDQVRQNADNPIDPDMDATRFLTQQMLIRQEIDWASNAFATGIWDTDRTPGTLWSAAGSTPIADIETGKQTVMTATGYVPNTLIISYKAFSALVDNSDIVDRIKFTSQDSVTPDLLARVFNVDRCLIMSSVYNTAAALLRLTLLLVTKMHFFVTRHGIRASWSLPLVIRWFGAASVPVLAQLQQLAVSDSTS